MERVKTCQVVVLSEESDVVEDLVEHGVGDDSALLGGAQHLVHVLLRVRLDAPVLLTVAAIHYIQHFPTASALFMDK